MWNTDHFSEAGFDAQKAPQTVAELDDYAFKLTQWDSEGKIIRLGMVPWVSNWGLEGWLPAMGGETFDFERRRPWFDHPGNPGALEWFESYVIRYGGQSTGDMRNGSLSMRASSTSQLASYKLLQPIWAGPVPHRAEGRNGTWGGGQCFVIPVGAKNPEAAMEFLLYTVQPEVQLKLYRLTGALPTRMDAIERLG